MVKHWKRDQKGVGFLSLDPVKIQCDEAEQAHPTSHLHLLSQWSLVWGSTGLQKVPSNLNHSMMNLTAACIKPFKTPALFQAVRGLFKTSKPPAETEKMQ